MPTLTTDDIESLPIFQCLEFLKTADVAELDYIFKSLPDEQLDKIHDYSAFQIMDREYPKIGC